MSEQTKSNQPEEEPVESPELAESDLEQASGGISMNFDKLIYNDAKLPKPPIPDGSSNT